MSVRALLDSERNPWRYVWRCAVRGHRLDHDGQVRPGDCCTRCGKFQPIHIEKPSQSDGPTDEAVARASGDSRAEAE